MTTIAPTVTRSVYDPATGVLTLMGTNLTTTASDYTATDLTLTGEGGNSYTLTGGKLVAGSLTGSSAKITLTAADQLAVDGLLNKDGTVANDASTTYNLSATAGWDTGAAAISTDAVTVTGFNAPTIGSIVYTPATGEFTISGRQLSNLGASTGIQLSDFSFQNLFQFNSSDSVSQLTGSGFDITLSAADQTTVNNLLAGAKSVHLGYSAGWDSDVGAAVSAKNVSILPGINAASYNAATGQLALAGKYLTTSATGYAPSHFTLTGEGGARYTLTGGSVVGSPTSSGVTLQLNSADQTAIAALLDLNGTAAGDGTAYHLSASAGWDTKATAIASQAVAVSGVPPETVSGASYNAATGQLALAGNHLIASASGYVLTDFTLTGEGGARYTLTGGGVVAGSASSSGVTLQLSATDQTALAALLDLNGNRAGDGTAYTLTASAGWDTGANAITSQAVSASGVPPEAVSGVSYNAATGQLTLVGNHLIASASGYVPTDFTLTGAGGASYTLTGGSVVTGSATSSGVTLQLNAADQQAVDNLLNYNGNSALDGTAYTLSATAGWDTNATAISGQAVTVSGGLYPYVLLQTLSVGVSDPGSVAVDSQGDVFVVNQGHFSNHKHVNGSIEELSANGTLLRTLSDATTPARVAVDNNGDVFVTNNNTVLEFSANGTLLQTLSNGISNSYGVAVDSHGDVFVMNANVSGTVEEFSADGTLLLTLSAGLAYPTSIALDSHGDVFVSILNSSTVEEFSADGTLLLTLSNGLGNPNSVAVDAQGDIYVASPNGLLHTVEKFSADGTLLQILSKGFDYPMGVAVDSHGDVFVAYYNGTVKEFSANGSLLQTLSSGVHDLQGLVLDSQGDVFVANSGNNTVEEFGVQLLGVSPPTAL